MFFNALSTKSKESFNNSLAANCEIKSIKKNDKVAQDLASIYLKEATFADVKKNVTKERGQLRLIQK